MARDKIVSVDPESQYGKLLRVSVWVRNTAARGYWIDYNSNEHTILFMSSEHIFHAIQHLRNKDIFLFEETIQILRSELLSRK